MDFIIGGAYQGKLEYAVKRFELHEKDTFNCSECDGIDYKYRCINRLEEFSLRCVKNNRNAVSEFESHRGDWQNSILICEDIFCGVVPLGAEMRAWREQTGRLCVYLAREADTVTRIFCGLEQRLK